MNLATTTSDFSCIKDHKERVRCLYEAGFRYVDLSMYTVYEGDPLFEDGWREYAGELLKLANELGVEYVQAHSPNTNNLAGEEGYSNALKKTVRAIEICGILKIPNLVVHAGWDRSISDREVWFEKNRPFFQALFPSMERCRVNVLCENSTKANMPTWYYLNTGADMRAFIDYVDHPRFGGCWDTGHANIEGAQYQQILALGDKLYGIHFNDNRGKQDEHIIPFMGTMNVDEIMSALKAVDYRGVFTFECDSPLRPQYYWLGNRRAFEGTLAEPPLALKKEMEKFLFQVGKCILTEHKHWQNG